MSEEVKRIKREEIVVKEVVEMKIEVSGKFYDQVMKAKAQVEEQTGRKFSNGEYIEEAMDDMVLMIRQLQEQIVALDAAARLPDVQQNEASPEEKTHDEREVHEQMYGHLSPDGKDDPAFG